MAVPVVAIVGRPNVGKSSLFNWLAGRRIAIVDPTAGVTRDRVSTLVSVGGRHFELIDTGGMGFEDPDNLSAEVERQIQTDGLRSAATVQVCFPESGLKTQGAPVKVHVEAPFTFIPIVGVGTITLAADATMRLEQSQVPAAGGLITNEASPTC